MHFLLGFILPVIIFYDTKKRFGKPHFLWTLFGFLFVQLPNWMVTEAVSNHGRPPLVLALFFLFILPLILSFVGFKLYRAFTPMDNSS
jgi:hypothetical protein